MNFNEFVLKLKANVESFEEKALEKYPDLDGVDMDEGEWQDQFLSWEEFDGEASD